MQSPARRQLVDQSCNMHSFDIIGDIHGYADTLAGLLRNLGYVEQDGIYRHPARRLIFAGDFIDRGPKPGGDSGASD
jgi:hypothetical protein